MTRDLNVIGAIQYQKNRELSTKDNPPLDPEGVALAKHCRITFDIIEIPADPKR